VPSPRCEFSHPNAVIVLDRLVFYYSGLSDEYLYTRFGPLDVSDQASRSTGDIHAFSSASLPILVFNERLSCSLWCLSRMGDGLNKYLVIFQ